MGYKTHPKFGEARTAELPIGRLSALRTQGWALSWEAT